LATPFEQFKSRLKIGQSGLNGVGYNYTPTILQQGQTPEQVGQDFLNKLTNRKNTGQSLYDTNRQENTSRIASDVIKRSAGLNFDEWGKPDIKLADFGQSGQNWNQSIGRRGTLATQTEEAKAAR